MKIFRYLLPIFLATHAYGMDPSLTRTEAPEYVNAQVKVAFVPQDDVKKELFDFLNQAQKSVYVSVFSLTYYKIIDKLVELKEKGIDVRLIIDEKQYHDDVMRNSDLSHAISRLSPRKILLQGKHMHNKFAVVDDKLVWTGSANFTYSGLFNNYENIVIIESPEIALKYKEVFNTMLMESVGLDRRGLESSEIFSSSFEDSQTEESTSGSPLKKLKVEGGGSAEQKITEEDESEEDFEEEELEGEAEFEEETPILQYQRGPTLYQSNVLVRHNYSPEILTYDEAYYLVGQIQRGKKHLIPTPSQVATIKGRDWNFSIEGLDKSTASQIINQISEEEGWPPSRR